MCHSLFLCLLHDACSSFESQVLLQVQPPAAKQSAKLAVHGLAVKPQAASLPTKAQQHAKPSATQPVTQPPTKSPKATTHERSKSTTQPSQSVPQDKQPVAALSKRSDGAKRATKPVKSPAKAAGMSVGSVSKPADIVKNPAEVITKLVDPAQGTVEPVKMSAEQVLRVSPAAQRKALAQKAQPQQGQTASLAQAASAPKVSPAAVKVPQHQGKSSKTAAVTGSKLPVDTSRRDTVAIDDAKVRQRQPSEGASDSDMGGVAFQSGYHMSDSPVLVTSTDEEEEVLAGQVGQSSRQSISAKPSPGTVVTAVAPSRGAVNSCNPSLQSALPASSNSVPGTQARAVENHEVVAKPTATSDTIAPVARRTPPVKPAAVVGITQSPAFEQATATGATRSVAAKQVHPTPTSTTTTAIPSIKPPQVSENSLSKQDRPQTSNKVAAGQKRSAASAGLQSPQTVSAQPSPQSSPDAASQGRRKARKAIHYPAAGDTMNPASTLATAPAVVSGGPSKPVTAQSVAVRHAAGDVSQTTSQREQTSSQQGKPAGPSAAQPTASTGAKGDSAPVTVTKALAQTQQASAAGQAAHKSEQRAAKVPVQVSTSGVAAATQSVELPTASRSAGLTRSPPLDTLQRKAATQSHKSAGQQHSGVKDHVPSAHHRATESASLSNSKRANGSELPSGQGKAAQITAKLPDVTEEPASPQARAAAFAVPAPVAPPSKAAAASKPPSSSKPAMPSSKSLAAATPPVRRMQQATAALPARPSAEAPPPLPSSDSGESMDIDEDEDRQTPPLPDDGANTEMLQLATIDSGNSQDRVAVSAGVSQLMSDRLLRIQVCLCIIASMSVV